MFRVSSNIDYKAINDLIDFEFRGNVLEIIIEVKEETGVVELGEIDQTFLAYLILKLKSSSSQIKKLIFQFNRSFDESRIYSLKHQLEHLNFIFKDSLTINLQTKEESVDVETGEILTKIKSFPLKNKISQSGAFISPLYISKELNSTDIYFSGKNNSQIKELFEVYLSGVKEKIVPKIRKLFIGELKLDELSYVEIGILNICLHERVNLLLEGKRTSNKKKNEELIINLINFSKKLAKGLKELSVNIEEHSQSGNGVITIRSFDKNRILTLKSNDEKEYLLNKEYDWFLDINVVDLGSIDIRKKYIENIKLNIDSFANIIKNRNSNNKNEISEKVKKSLFDELNEDITTVSNDKEFGYKDFFIINKGRKSLNHQRNKLLTRIGLQFFTQLVAKKYDGYIKTSSGYEKSILFIDDEDKFYTDVKYSEEFIKKGTSFSCLVPIKNWEENEEKEDSNIDEDKSASINSFDYLKEFKFVDYNPDLNNLNDRTIINYKPDISDFDNDKYNANLDISLNLSQIKNIKGSILLINYDEIISNNKLINESYWLRFLWALNEYVDTIIIYNNLLQDFKDISFIRHLWHSNGADFWEKGKRVLFYSKKYKSNDFESEYFRYGANLLAGETSSDFNILNNNIWNHHYSHKEGVFVVDEDDRLSSEGKKQLKSHLYNGKNLHYFEVLLKTKTVEENEISLFEKSVQYSLNTLFVEKESSDTNNKGYKIENTHFKLGSKIHISDFYYAKKLFQNSFFTTPLAFLISEQIKLDHPKTNNISLIGYESYSDFLVSTIRNFLSKGESINHFTIDKNGVLSRELPKLKKNVILIVPIASTFNTSLKIEEQLSSIKRKLDNNKPKILPPYYNIVLVAHREDERKLFEGMIEEDGKVKEFVLKNKDESIENIYYKYNWKKIDKDAKTVVVEKYDKSLRKQKYSIPVFTQWQEASKCNICFPDNIKDEKCLIETGKASITPQLIFGFPKIKPTNNEIASTKGLLLKESIMYGNLKKQGNSYLYFYRTGKIISDEKNKENEKNIIDWLKDKVKPIFDTKYSNSKIVLVTPASSSHSRFIDLVNEKVFDFRANCIVISLKEDYIENSESLYADGLHRADIVIYVDDVLLTVNSFVETNYIVKYIREKNKTGRGIDYCITLINRMSYSSEENLLLKLTPLINDEVISLVEKINICIKERQLDNDNLSNINYLIRKIENEEIDFKDIPNRLLYYTKINNPPIEEANKKFPLDLERKRYKKLSKTSSLDSVRKYFHLKYQALKSITIDDKLKDYSNKEKGRKDKKLYQLLVLDAIYDIFEVKNTDDDKDVRIKRINSFFPKINLIDISTCLNSLKKLSEEINERLKKDELHKDIIEDNENNLQYVIIKVLCNTPLVYYKEIREISFQWVNMLLMEIIEKIKSLNFSIIEFFTIKPGSYYSDYRTLKFLLKKSVRLNGNFIIRKDFFEAVRILLENLKDIEKNEQLKLEKDKDETLFKEKYNEIVTKYPDKEKQINEYVENLIRERIIDEELIKQEDKNNNESSDKKDELEGDLFTVSVNTDNFNKDFRDLRDMLFIKPSSSKMVIYHFLSLVQELIFDNEVKAYKLDENINEQINNSDDLKNNIENGNFFHFLQLLKLENTEILNSLSDYVNKKYFEYFPKDKTNIKIESLKESLNKSESDEDRDNSLNLNNDDKYDLVLKSFQGGEKKNIDSFLLLNALFRNYSLNPSYNEDKTMEVRINEIFEYCKQIIGPNIVNNIIFSVNYLNKPNTLFSDFYHFFLDDKESENKIDLSNDSISAQFSKGLKDTSDSINTNYTLSNLEIIKDKSGETSCRKKIFEEDTDLKNNKQIISLKKDSSILLIRISDFDEGDNLYTQGVITFYLDKGERLKEEKLRLLLALRHHFSDYLKKETSGTTFLEILQLEEKNQLIEKNTHYLSKFFRFIDKGIKNLNNYEDYKNVCETMGDKLKAKDIIKEEIDIALFALKTQLNSIDDDGVVVVRKIKSNELVNRIKTILESDLENNSFHSETYSILGLEDNNLVFEIPISVYNIIITQILINIKEFTFDKKNQIKIYYIEENNNGYLVFENFIDIDIKNSRDIKNKKSGGNGLLLCEKIILRSHTISFEKIKDYFTYGEKNNIYSVKLKIK